MSKKSQKFSSQQQAAQPSYQSEASRHKRQSSAEEPKGASAALRDSCDLSSANAAAGLVVAPEIKQVRASENNGEKLSRQKEQQQHQQHQQATLKFERNKRAKLQLAAGSAENKLVSTAEKMTDAHSARLAPGHEQRAADREQSEQNICAACAEPIRERYLLMALDKRWHEDCLKCACCDCRLGEVGSSLFTHSDKLLCRRDFLRIFGKKGLCAACHRQIPAYELVMRAQEKAYHMDCFACQRCQYRFCVGDQFHMTQAHKIICLLCHREQLERCQQQQQQQQARQVAAGLLAAQVRGAADGRLELAADCVKADQLDMDKPEGTEKPLELAQLESVARHTPPEAVASGLVACPVQQMRLPSQKEQERACVV